MHTDTRRPTRRCATPTRRDAMCTHMQTHDGIRRVYMCATPGTSVCVRVVCALVRRSHDYLNITLRPCTHVYMGCIQWLSRFSILPRQSRKIFRHAAAADTAPDKSDEGAVESRMQESIFRIRSVYPRYISRARIFCFCLKGFYNKEKLLSCVKCL